MFKSKRYLRNHIEELQVKINKKNDTIKRLLRVENNLENRCNVLEEQNKKLKGELAAAKVAITFTRLAYAAKNSAKTPEEFVNNLKKMAETDKTKELKEKVLKAMDCCEGETLGGCEKCPYWGNADCASRRNNDVRKLLGAEVKNTEEKKEEKVIDIQEPTKTSEPTTETAKEDKTEDPETTFKKRVIEDLKICSNVNIGCVGCTRYEPSAYDGACGDKLMKDAIKALGGETDET